MAWGHRAQCPCPTTLGLLSRGRGHGTPMGRGHRTDWTIWEGHQGSACALPRGGYGEKGPAVDQDNARRSSIMRTPLLQQNLSLWDTMPRFTLPSPKKATPTITTTSSSPTTHQPHTTYTRKPKPNTARLDLSLDNLCFPLMKKVSTTIQKSSSQQPPTVYFNLILPAIYLAGHSIENTSLDKPYPKPSYTTPCMVP